MQSNKAWDIYNSRSKVEMVKKVLLEWCADEKFTYCKTKIFYKKISVLIKQLIPLGLLKWSCPGCLPTRVLSISLYMTQAFPEGCWVWVPWLSDSQPPHSALGAGEADSWGGGGTLSTQDLWLQKLWGKAEWPGSLPFQSWWAAGKPKIPFWFPQSKYFLQKPSQQININK